VDASSDAFMAAIRPAVRRQDFIQRTGIKLD
jgi:hypothetical protein